MKAIALNDLNMAADNGRKRSKEEWQRRGERLMGAATKAAGFVCVVAGPFYNDAGPYFRVHYAAQPVAPRIRARFIPV